jgi:hypothetical protein
MLATRERRLRPGIGAAIAARAPSRSRRSLAVGSHRAALAPVEEELDLVLASICSESSITMRRSP